MMAPPARSRIATLAAVALAGAVLWWARDSPSRPGGGTAAAPASGDPAEPQAVVWRMVDASRARDVGAYLECFAGELRTRLDASARELGEQGFADYLGRRVGELKGVALYDVTRPQPGRAEVTIEYVFATEKELQRLYLEESRGRWLIAKADESRREKSLIPYGTPIEEVE